MLYQDGFVQHWACPNQACRIIHTYAPQFEALVATTRRAPFGFGWP
jgi:hypothetical protein